MIKIKELLLFIFGTLFIGFLGSFLGDFDIYNNLTKPSFAPPSYIFPIMWTILYVLMGISAYMIYESGSKNTKRALNVYFIQLFINVIWSYIFFGLQLRLLALIWLILLLVTVIYMIVLFYKIKPKVALLQIPYLLWLIFAGILNYSIYILNN
ncbi:MAG: tryptophan-rich sensory protein [Clostridia bacterium]|nr:tryptophan-rich sensory protein [Clostridia bacterium]